MSNLPVKFSAIVEIVSDVWDVPLEALTSPREHMRRGLRTNTQQIHEARIACAWLALRCGWTRMVVGDVAERLDRDSSVVHYGLGRLASRMTRDEQLAEMLAEAGRRVEAAR